MAIKLLFVVNPISGGIDKEPFLAEATELCLYYGVAFRVFKTTGKNDSQHLLETLDEFKPDKVAAVGGDGITLFTSTTLLGSGYPIGIIPLGSANGMATELGVNPEPLEALKDIIMSSIVRGLDMVKVNGEHYCIHLGDVGINAQIVKNYEEDENRGMATYAKYFIDALDQPEYIECTIEANGESTTYKGLMFAICNARKYGTGVPLNLVGNPMDGQFELVIVKENDTISFISAGLASFDESFFDDQNNQLIVTPKATLNFDRPRLLQLDGEVIGEFETIDVEIVPNAVPFITTKGNPYVV